MFDPQYYPYASRRRYGSCQTAAADTNTHASLYNRYICCFISDF